VAYENSFFNDILSGKLNTMLALYPIDNKDYSIKLYEHNDQKGEEKEKIKHKP
jgi:hypothetical protein